MASWVSQGASSVTCGEDGGACRSRRECPSNAGSNSKVNEPSAARRISRAGSEGPDRIRTSPRREPPVRSWTTSSMSGRSPGGSPVAVRCVNLAEQRPDDIHTAGKCNAGQVGLRRIGGHLQAKSPEVAHFALGKRLTQGGHAGMEPQRKVGHDRGAGLFPAQRDLVVRFRVRTGRMQADDGQTLGGGAAEGLAARRDRPAHDHRVDPRLGQGVVEIARRGDSRHRGVGEARKGPIQSMFRMFEEPVRPGKLLLPISQDQDIHRSVGSRQ